MSRLVKILVKKNKARVFVFVKKRGKRIYPSLDTIKALYDSGMLFKQIASKLGISYKTFYNHCSKSLNFTNAKYVYPTKDEIIHKISKGLTLKKIAEAAQIPYKAFTAHCRYYNIKTKQQHTITYEDLKEDLKSNTLNNIIKQRNISNYSIHKVVDNYEGNQEYIQKLDDINFSELYYEQNLSVSEISERVNIKRPTLCSWIVRAGYMSKQELINKRNSAIYEMYKQKYNAKQIKKELCLSIGIDTIRQIIRRLKNADTV